MDKLKQFFKNKIYRKNIYMFIVLPILLNLAIESLSRDSIIQGIKYIFVHPVSFICNTLIILTALSVGLLIKRRVFYASVISAICIFLGYMNRTLLKERVTPFNASDLKLLDAAVSIVDKYVNFFTMVLVAGIISVVAIIIVLLFIKGPKVKYKINYWKNLIIIGLVVLLNILTINVSIDTGFMSEKFTNLTNAYNKYGFLYCFGNGLLNTGVKKPSGYSQDKIGQILGEIKNEGTNNKTQDGTDNNVTKKPNIIFLQLESFFDISQAKDIQFSSDPIPYFNQLRKEYSSGYLNVFNVGYGTCNTEFEIMTSMNLDDFGPGEIPYKTVLKNKVCESVAFDLKDYGYSTHAIHNNDATFYSRKTVFPHLGYDTFTSIEFMNVDEVTPEGWAKDKCLTGEIMKALQSTDKPDFVYTISVQGHGSYPTSKVLDNPAITVVSGIEDEGRKNAVEYYANEIHEMDEFLKELTDALTAYGEDTILVMYGDHLPGLGFSASELASDSIYKTNYVIWNNFNMPKEDEDIRSYQLAPKVLKSLNMTNGVINRYHQTYKDSEEYLSGLQNLEYDILYGDQIAYDGVSPYAKTNMKMGIDDIDITKLEVEKVEDDQYVKIMGNNFTKSSKVFINGDRFDTEFIDNNTLRVKYNDLNTLDSFVVSQVDKDSGYVVSSTKECLYYGQ